MGSDLRTHVDSVSRHHIPGVYPKELEVKQSCLPKQVRITTPYHCLYTKHAQFQGPASLLFCTKVNFGYCSFGMILTETVYLGQTGPSPFSINVQGYIDSETLHGASFQKLPSLASMAIWCRSKQINLTC